MNPVIRIELLGGLVLRTDAITISRFRTRKTALLLAILAGHRNRIFPRDELSDLLWPEDTLESGRNGLRIALSSLRKLLEPPGTPFGAILDANRNSVTLNATAFSTDVEEFQRATHSESRQEEAFRLYGGEYLPGFDDEWILAERQRLEELYLAVLLRLAEGALAAGDARGSVEMAKRAIQVDPYEEQSYRIAVAAYEKAGRNDSARQMEEAMNARFSRDTAPLLPGRPPPPKQEAQPSGPVPSTSRPSHLPAYYTRLYGRDEELKSVVAAFSEDLPLRLMTLAGPGGVGKTRLATEAAHRLEPVFGGNVWFAQLADVWEGTYLLAAIAGALGKEDGSRNADERLAEIFGGHAGLLVLDNLEQILAAAREAIRSLLARFPDLRMIVTSRRRLGIDGEQVLPLEPLATPGAELADLEQLAANPSVQLFVDRARAVRPDFAVTARSASDIAEVCQMLSGLPLALELAAARIRVLSPRELREHAASRLELLSSPRGDRVARHQSLRASLDWGFDLLGAEEQQALARLSVFPAGWTIGAARAVLSDLGPTIDLLDGLVADSLAFVRDEDGESRYGMLEPVREYAESKLSSADLEATRARMVDYFAGFTVRASEGFGERDQKGWLDRVERELPNLRAVRAFMAERADPRQAAFAADLWPYFLRRGLVSEGGEWLERALEGAAPSVDRLRALLAASKLAETRADSARSLEFVEIGLQESHALELPLWTAELLGQQGVLARRIGDIELSERVWRQGLELAAPDAEVAARLRMNLAINARDRKEFDLATRLYEEALPVYRKIGDPHRLAVVYQNLGLLACDQGDFDGSIDYLERALKVRREIGDFKGQAYSLGALGQTSLAAGSRKDAWGYYRECLELCVRLGFRSGVEDCVWDLAIAWAQEGPAAAAARLLGMLGRTHRDRGVTILPYEREEREAALKRLPERLGPEKLRQEIARGERMSLEEAAELAASELALLINCPS